MKWCCGVKQIRALKIKLIGDMFNSCGCKSTPQLSWQEKAMSAVSRVFVPERFQDSLRAGWLKPRYISTNLAFLPDGRLRITPYEDSVTWPVDAWAIGIELSIIDADDERRDPERFLLRHAFGSCEITTQYRSLLPHPIPLVPTSRRAHRWWIEGMDRLWSEHYYFSARLVVVEVPGSHGPSLDDFMAVYYARNGQAVGQIAIDHADYSFPGRCLYLPDSEPFRERATAFTLAIPPTCRLFDIRRDLSGGYQSFEALTEPMDIWNFMVWRRPGLVLANAKGLMWMDGRGAGASCASVLAGFKEELTARTWAPCRHIEWCLDVEEQAEMLADGETFESWREAAAAAEKKMSE